MQAKEQPHKQPGQRLRVTVDERSGDMRIEGNKAGLEYLSAVCLSVIGEPVGPNEWHLSPAFTTLEEPSCELYICYKKEFES